MEASSESNYDKMTQQAATLFIRHDQAQMIEKWDLLADARYLYIPYFSREPVLRIDREDGRLSYTEGYTREHPEVLKEPEDLNNASMIIYDLLTYAKQRPAASGRWASISALGGIIGAGHESTLQPKEVRVFTGRTKELDAACRHLGGVPMQQGDVSYVFTVFADFRVWFQFWDADEEFPAVIKYLFDENALAYMHYETLWYVMGDLARRIMAQMEEASS